MSPRRLSRTGMVRWIRSWQHDDGGRLPGGQNLFNGSTARLKRFARLHRSRP
ncbi:hypothetical protein [Streptomyces sp. KLOTTS4A1]|uniref:hypothetical protein n=1 Tax=Streptomyces sp. KLOTTS4A1 TaxID=3390996 RepID=UPI0039F5E21A